MDQKRQELISLLHSARRVAQELQDELTKDLAYRRSVADASHAVTRTIQTTSEQAWEIFLQPILTICLKTSLDAGWLDDIAQADKLGITAKELISTRGADRSLAIRVMRVLAAGGVINEIGLTTYAPNELTKTFTSVGVRDGIRHMSDDNAVTVSRMPVFLANTNYQIPPDAVNSVYTFAQGAPFWNLLATRPARQEAFDNFMVVFRHQKRNWLDVYPIEKLRVHSDDDVLLIHIGGARGHCLTEFNAHRLASKMPGRLVLQDRREVLDQMPEGWQRGFAAFQHDIFNPQPHSCWGARTYYLKMIMHVWPDHACITILRHLHDAMKPGYSTLLINDIVLHDIGCSFFGAAFDISLMAMVSGKQRTRNEWVELVGHVDGLRIDKIWTLEEGAESVIEVVRIG